MSLPCSGAGGALAPPLRWGGGAVRAAATGSARGLAARGLLSCAAAAALEAPELWEEESPRRLVVLKCKGNLICFS